MVGLLEGDRPACHDAHAWAFRRVIEVSRAVRNPLVWGALPATPIQRLQASHLTDEFRRVISQTLQERHRQRREPYVNHLAELRRRAKIQQALS